MTSALLVVHERGQESPTGESDAPALQVDGLRRTIVLPRAVMDAPDVQGRMK
jgi:hypothetical protein